MFEMFAHEHGLGSETSEKLINITERYAYLIDMLLHNSQTL